MYEIFIKSWYQELPGDGIQEESFQEFEDLEAAFEYLKANSTYYMEIFPLVEMGIRVKNK